jgi:DNA-directed RNA polymerase subunit RPC12/RpoP
MENKIQCPNCSALECYEEVERGIKSYLCMKCGYTTNSLFVNGSDKIEKWEETTPMLIKQSKYIDPDTNLVWYPAVLNFPSIGMIFPDGASELDWMWRTARIVPIPEDEQKNHPIPGKDGEFYVSKLDMENSNFYERDQFKQACIDIGILIESENETR